MLKVPAWDSQGQQIGGHDIPHKYEIPGLQTVAIDPGLLPGQKFFDEDGHHAGFSLAVLAGPDRHWHSAGDGDNAMFPLIEVQVVLHRHLGDAVGRLGPGPVFLPGRQRGLIAVNGAAGGGKDDLLHPAPAAA